MKCPNCGLINPETALRCDCGYDFAAKQMRGSYLTSRQRAVVDVPPTNKRAGGTVWSQIAYLLLLPLPVGLLLSCAYLVALIYFYHVPTRSEAFGWGLLVAALIAGLPVPPALLGALVTSLSWAGGRDRESPLAILSALPFLVIAILVLGYMWLEHLV